MTAPPRVEGVYLPMLAKNSEPFEDDAWAYERKYDGMRAIITCKDGTTMLTSRTAMDLTHQFPEFDQLHKTFQHVVLDGEIVVFRKDGTEDLEALQLRMGLQDPEEIESRRKQFPASLVLFDILQSITRAPQLNYSYLERRHLLELLVGGGTDLLRLSQQVQFQDIPKGWEGIVAKKKLSIYEPGKRRATWKKWKVEETIDCVVTGWTEGKGEREGQFGALRIAIYENDVLTDIGLVGSGFNEANLQLIDEWIRDRTISDQLIVEVEYMGWTKTHKLREPRFKCIRYDKRPKECTIGPEPR